jgi:probable phosphoglycerate mutase
VNRVVPDGLDASLLLLRHGETEFLVERRFQGRSETPLSLLGRRQAELAGDRIAHPGRPPALPVSDGPPRFVAHSPLRRTTEMATAVSRALDAAGSPDVPLLAEPGLVEIHQGAWEGLHQEEVARRYGPELAAWRRIPRVAHAPGGEPLDAVDARVRAGVAPLLDALAFGQEPGRPDRPPVIGYGSAAHGTPWGVIVGHDGSFKVLLLALLELPLDAFWRLPFALAGISVVEIRGGRASLRLHNAVDHLSDLTGKPPTPDRVAGAL